MKDSKLKMGSKLSAVSDQPSERATVMTCFAVEPDRKRVYSLDVWEPGRCASYGGYYVFSDFRLQRVLIEVFRKWYGHAPTGYWALNGFMGGAWDERGNEIVLSQIKNY